uniref:Uncharacterized protein n=1 Tax=Cucumis sativus TaxID=3659 RepID=A0A0A0KZC0_CUCSA
MQSNEEGRKKEENGVCEIDDWKSGKKKGKVSIVLGGADLKRESPLVMRSEREGVEYEP